MKAMPLDEALADDIEKGEVSSSIDPKIRSRYMADTYQWVPMLVRFGASNLKDLVQIRVSMLQRELLYVFPC